MPARSLSAIEVLKREYPAELGNIDVFCGEVRTLMQGCEKRERFIAELLTREVMSNAIRHGCRQDAQLTIQCTFRLGKKGFQIRVTDAGDGFDWRSMLKAKRVDEADNGRGIRICLLYASRVAYNEKGNGILLWRRFQKEGHMSEKVTVTPGDLITSSVPEWRTKIKSMIDQGVREITVDMVSTQMVDSMGIGLLIQVHNTLEKCGGKLVVVHASVDVLELFRAMRLDQRFSVSA